MFVAAGNGGIAEVTPFTNAMMDLVVQVDDAIHEINPDAYLAINGDPYIVTNTIGDLSSPHSVAFLDAVDAFLLDNLFGVAATTNFQLGNTTPAIDIALSNIQPHAQLLSIDHSGTQAEFDVFVETAWSHDIIPYTSPTPNYNNLTDFSLLNPATESDDVLRGGSWRW